jgi:ADP-heptose:LPS heptosyltransferase
MLANKTTHVVLVGGEMDRLLQAGWEEERRVHLKAGEWTVRESMAFVETCDLVVGSETGLLNAAGCTDVPKVVLLSHSTPENLTTYWKNAVTITPPKSVSCYPCHRLHRSFEYCFQDEATGSAVCQAEIDIETVWEAIQGCLSRRMVA